MVGFTAWSSVREPSQVFTLLESVYHAFDQIARKRRVFKVETVGDSYVAVAGLPEPRADHATVMARFANDCLKKIHILTKKLVVVLGPDTESLTMRCVSIIIDAALQRKVSKSKLYYFFLTKQGLHSGPVTAGVLRGERSRFQLFGDTMNTASRMESTGVKDKIQISQETADLLIAAGKVHWLTQREDKVVAKGKGEVETYWVCIEQQGSQTIGGSRMNGVMSPNSSSDRRMTRAYSSDSLDDVDFDNLQPLGLMPALSVNLRLVDWNVELLLRQLKCIAAGRRKAIPSRQQILEENLDKILSTSTTKASTVLDEVKEVIRLPNFNARCAKNLRNYSDTIVLNDGIEDELREYVMRIARMYRKNPFHNFEHASHVTMSVSKLLSRVVNPGSEIEPEAPGNDKKKTASELHCFSYGITSDPLTQFACLFSALIHDVEHSGVPNTVLITENPELAQKYKEKSIAEQNSVDQAWSLLFEDDFKNLRDAIYCNQDELQRFRQLVVNSVMATDIMDKDLKQLRNNRWDKVFSAEECKLTKGEKKDNFNRKATIVIEHLIQASDVSHTMQHWHIYQKWNERLFEEMLYAHTQGRSTFDPTTCWYDSELGFFDNYIIPLAKKLKDCGVFGVSSDEYLTYALQNRSEFAEKGKVIIENMIQKYSKVNKKKSMQREEVKL
jgi:class 3 adenylate cyclase